jgi:hypothetical protein
MIKLFLAIYLVSNSAHAQSLLTEEKSNIILTIPSAGEMTTNDYQARAQTLLNFVETKLYKSVPANILSKINAKKLRIEFTSKIKKGGLFNPVSTHPDELLLQVRENLFADESVFRLIAHEWFHAVHYVLHPDEPSWVREGMAQVFETIALGGYNGPNLISALENSTTPLEFSFDIERTDREAYGHVFTYFYFLYKNCGADATFWKIAQSESGKFGKESINFALSNQTRKECENFETSVLHAELARFHNRKTQGKTTQTDLYWLTTEFQRPAKTVDHGIFDQVVVDELPAHQPLLLNKSYKAVLKSFLKNKNLAIYTLSKSYPYLVSQGLTSIKSIDGEVLFVMKKK